MKQKKIAIDFGTTNSSIAVFRDGIPTILQNEKGSAKTMKTAAFVFYDSMNRKPLLKFGLEAQRAIRIEHTKSFEDYNRQIRLKYFHSLKMLLASRINEFSIGTTFSIAQVCAQFLQKLTDNMQTDKAIFSVPVKYHEDPVRHAAALEKFREIIELAGFDRGSPFVLEPVAAMCSRPDLPDGKILVCDIGGGTSDFALIEKIGKNIVVQKTWGKPIGGGMFDLQFGKKILSPVLGEGFVKPSVFDKFFSADMANLGSLRAPRFLSPMFQLAETGKKEGVKRMHDAISRGSLGEILDKVEEVKILLNDVDNICIPDFPIHPATEVSANYEQLSSVNAAQVFEKLILQISQEAGVVDTLFLTGGFSKSRLIKEMFSRAFNVKNVISAETTAIGLGLLITPENLYL